MAFDEIQFPLKVSFGSLGGICFSTEVVTTDGGQEKRNQNWSQARRRYDAQTGVRTVSDAMLLSAFFQARAGRARGFRLRDWSDYSSALDGVSTPAATDQEIGTGDGSTVSFQLVKNYGDDDVLYTRSIRKPVSGSLKVAVNGTVLDDGWSVDASTGALAFANAPSSGSLITAGFLFDVPVRFDTDQLLIAAQDQRQAKAEIPLLEIRV